MTYHMTKTHRRPARAPAMGDWISDLVAAVGGPGYRSPEVQCVDSANATVAPLDARINTLAGSWCPTGFYTPDQVLAILQQGNQLGTTANDKVRNAPLSTSDADTVKNMAITAVQKKMADGNRYALAANDAKAKGIGVVDAPGLRDWLIQMMSAARDSLTTAAALDCNTPWLAFVVITLAPIWDTAVAIVKQIGGIIVSAGQAIVKVATALPDIVTYVKWGGLAALGVAAIYKLKQIRDGK